MRRWGILGGVGMVVMALVITARLHGVMPDGWGQVDDIDWYGVRGIGA